MQQYGQQPISIAGQYQGNGHSSNGVYHQPSQARDNRHYDPVKEFKMNLQMLKNTDTKQIEGLAELAMIHYKRAREISQVLCEQILQSADSLKYLYVMDSILKNVQGDYIDCFEQWIFQIMSDAFNKYRANENQLKSIMKMFKIWELFFQPKTIEIIAKALNFQLYEQQLLKQEDLEKVKQYRRVFIPQYLPDELIQQERYISGSDITHNQVVMSRRQQQNYQIQAEFPQQQMMGIVPQRDAYSGIPHNQQVILQNEQQRFVPPMNQTGMVDTMQMNSRPSSQMTAQILLNTLSRISQTQPMDQRGGVQGQQILQDQKNVRQRATYNPQQYAAINGAGIVGDQVAQRSLVQGVRSSDQLYSSSTSYHDNFAQKQYTVDNNQFGFLPSILKYFQQFKQSQQLLIGSQYTDSGKQSGLPPSFENPASLKLEYNVFAIAEVYQGIKFQCSICGLRFIRNLTLKKHLDTHFTKNNEIKRRGNRAISRPAFLTTNAFVQPKSSLANQKGVQGGLQGQQNLDEMVPYSSKEINCFICKEKLELVKDEDDETWYFIHAKRIKVASASKEQAKRKVVVHSDCLKQIELNKEQLKLRVEKQENEDVLGKRKKDEVIYENQSEQKDQKIDSIESIEQLIRGMNTQKRQFLGESV